ncbi:uncharacterized protein LOC134261591 isoform X1 [Saccostrea cucullata]|uniref:uncharacterized protein LOC134261591 isoform X1 n=1 Tax=Saccostrea cuccullata TaxID=36930 RepID=UPI002ED26F62
MLSKLALQKSVTVTGAKYSCHISYLTSDRVWISDGYNNLILTNTEGEKLHQLTDVISGDGVHTVNKDGELIYIDKNYNIIKLSLDKTKSSIINYTEAWRPRCVYSSPSTGDLLVVMFNTETDENKVARYNSAGENTQTIQHDSKGQELYKFPKYITENRNGDVIVSDLVHDVVVTDRGGNHRFSYTGPPSGNRLDPRGICTDAMLNILVCSHNTHTVQIIDKDGNFLSLVETSNHGMERPFGLSYNDKTHLLWVGSRYKNKVNIYRCLYGDSQIGLPLENLKCTRHPSDTLGKYCTQCEVDLCGKCIATSDEHKKHDVKEVEKLFRDIQKKDGTGVLICLLLCESYKINLKEDNWIKKSEAVANDFKFKKLKKQFSISTLKKYKPILRVLKQDSSEVEFSSEFFKNNTFLRFAKDPNFLDVFLTWAEKENIAEYCRSWAYPKKKGEVFCWLLPRQTEQLITKLEKDIFEHPTWKDASIHQAAFKNLGIPVQIIMRGDESVKNFMGNLKKGETVMYNASGMIIGCAGSGKSTLLGRLKGIDVEEIKITTRSTRGIDVHTDVFDVSGDTIENSSNQKQRFKVRMEEQNQTDDVTEHPSEFSDEKVSNIDEPEINGGKNQAASEEVDVEESTTPNTINTETEPYEPEEVAKPNEKEEEELGENDTNVSENAENLGILRVSKNVSEEPEKRITMVDFAGQCAYYASHQIFLSPRAFFILVLNMQKTLDDKVGEEVCSQKDSIFNGWTYRDYLIFWAKSIHQYSSEKAPALLVGTHAEGKTQREKVQFFRDIWETLETTDKSLQSHFNTKKMFAIGFDNRECIENIKRSIVDIVEDLDHWGEKLPHSWAMFENFFQEKKKLRIIGRRILLDFNEALPKEVKLQTLGDINTMLQFFHDIREILFFDKDILRDVIILDVQWFADAFKNVITDENHAEEDLIECAVEFAKFNETGELNDTLLSKIWKMSNREYIEYQNDIMLYMEKLALLAKIDEHNWYVPCMNKKQFPGNIFSQFPASSILCYMFDVLPAGIFQRLVVSCIQFPWSIVKERKGRKEYPCIYQTAVVFLFKEHNILLGMTSTEIQLQVCVIEGEVEIPTCFEIREKIENELNILSSTFQKNSKYHIGFKCKPEGFCDNEKSTIINESDLKNPTLQCISCPVERKHIINTKDITKYWKQVEDDSEEGNLHVLSIEMILNAVSRKLKVTSFMLASHCDVQMEESSKIFEEENRFRILYKWKCKTPVKDRFEELKRILRNQNDLKEAADSVETFQVTDFECSDIVLPSEVVSTNEFHILAEKIPKDYTHFVRFLGLPHIHIEELEVDGSPVKDRIYKSLLKLKEHHSKLSRLDICRALKFIERNDVIDDLNKIWTLGKKN